MKDNILRWINGYQPKDGKDNEKVTFDLDALKKKITSSVSDFFADDSLVKANKSYRTFLGLPQYRYLLPYSGFLQAEELFILEGNGFDDDGNGVLTAGFTLEVSPQVGADENMERVLQSVYLQAPKGTSITVSLYATPHIKKKMISRASVVLEDIDLGIEKEPWVIRNDNIYRKAIRNRIDFYNKGAYESLIPSNRGGMFRDYRCIISVVLPTSILDNNSIEEALSFRDSVESTLTSAHLPTSRWGTSQLLNWVSDLMEHERVLDPTHNYIDKEANPNLPVLRDNFTNIGSINSVSPSEISHGSSDSCFVSMSVTDFPKGSWRLSNMGNMIGDYFQGALAYPCPFLITMIAVCDDLNKFKSKATMMSARKTQLASSQAGRFVPGIHEEAAEWNYAISALDDGATMVQLGIKVTLMSPKKLVNKNVAEVRGVWSNKGFGIHQDTFLQPLGFKSVLPMGVTRDVTTDLVSMGHISPKFSTNATSLSPFIAEWKGTGTNTLSLFGRRGQLMGVDLYDNDQGNMNFAVVAGSGSGKSFFLNEMAFSYLSKGAKVWIIDVGRSYLKLCNVLKGDFIEFSEDSDICLNPFSFIVDINEDMEILKPLISQMMTGNDYRLTGVQFADLEKAIKSCWEKYNTKTTITLVRDELNEMCDTEQGVCPVGEMAKMLYPWTKDGIYGKYFEGEANLDFSNPFTVLELEELKSKKSLQTIVLMILMYRITNSMYVERDGVKKIVIIDEAWSLMSGGDTAEFIETGYRRARKYGGAFGTATQSVDDYYKNEGALAAFTNSDFVFLLRQKKESIDRLEKEGRLSLDPWKKRVLYDLTTKHGVYSEVYVSYPNGDGVGRLFVDPFTSLLYSSKDEDFQAIRYYESKGLETAEAIEAVLKDRNIHVSTHDEKNL